jgi:hypothetical protein
LLRPKEVCQILELVRAYSVPIRDDRVSKLIYGMLRLYRML